jgi:hypothetical protein
MEVEDHRLTKDDQLSLLKAIVNSRYYKVSGRAQERILDTGESPTGDTG